MAKGVKTGGRQKGVRNKATAKKEQEIAASGLTPLEYMLEIMRNELQEDAARLDAAKAAAPYVHPKLATIDIGNKDDKPFEIAEINKLDLARRIAATLAAGQAALNTTETKD
jgi:hypothetical protein